MSGIIFDGRKFAGEIESQLKDQAAEAVKKLGRKLKLVTIFNPEHKPSVVYSNIKAKMAERLGVEMVKYPISNLQYPIKRLLEELNRDASVDGVMIQQPLIGDKQQDQDLCNLIAPEKDVDGLGEKSKFLQATCRAVLVILNEVMDPEKYGFFAEAQNDIKVVVVGNRGLVGAGVEKELKKDPRCEVFGMDKIDFDPTSLKLRGASVVVSAVGEAGLIKPEMVKDGVIAIDVGYPQGDFVSEVAEKASFFTPVPGGVGPVTVVMLFRNLLEGN